MVDPDPPAPHSSQNQLSIKVKMSNMNLSKMSAYSNYSMFSNESNESLNTSSAMNEAEKSSCHTMTDSVGEDDTSPILSPSSMKLNFSMMKKSQSMISSSSSSKESSIGSVIARDKSLQSFTQALIHAEPEECNTKKEATENIYEVVDTNGGLKPPGLELIEMKAAAKRSDSSYTFQSYDCSSRSSTLSSNPIGGGGNGCRPIMGTRVLPPRNNT